MNACPAEGVTGERAVKERVGEVGTPGKKSDRAGRGGRIQREG